MFTASRPAPGIFGTIVRPSGLGGLGMLFGVVMPLVAALCYPTYMHQMAPSWVEWTRLLEFPFVVAEIVFIIWTQRRGLGDPGMLNRLPLDVKLAGLLLVIGLFVSSLLISRMPSVSLTISLLTLVHLRFALAVYALSLASRDEDFGALLFWLVVGLVPLTLLTIWRFSFPPPAHEVFGGVIEWASALPGFINVRHFGSWTGAVAAGLLVSLLFSTPPRWMGWSQAAYVFAAALTIWSGTRGALFGMGVATAVLALLSRRMPSFRAIGIVATLTGVACMLAWLLLWEYDTAFLLWVPADAQSPDTLTGGRLVLWSATFDRWLQSPLFGWGSGSVFWEVNIGWAHTQPHNLFLQFLISWGMVGAAGALWLLARALGAASSFAARQPRFYPILGMLFCLLAMSLIEGMLHYPRFIEPIFALLAMLLAARQRSNAHMASRQGGAGVHPGAHTRHA